MRKLSFTLLAASTMLIAGVATAQPGGGPRPGATWHGGGMGGGMQTGGGYQMHGGTMGGGYQMHGGARTGGGYVVGGGRTGGGYVVGGGRTRTGGVFRGPGGGNWRFHRWGPRPGNWRYGRLHRGGFINSFWFAPQFYIGDWQSYGFYAPGNDQRWVRYYDDAYLVDDYGRVVDTRYGLRWDRYGGDWDYQDGIPGWRGEWRDYDESAYAEGYDDEEYGEREDHAEMREDMRGGYREDMRGGRGPRGPMMPPPGYGPPPPGGGGYSRVYGGYGGYGMYAYPIVIETITTTGGGGFYEEVTEEVVQTAHRRVHRARPRCRCAPPPRRPRPPAGERG
jgi:hypothetical protein